MFYRDSQKIDSKERCECLVTQVFMDQVGAMATVVFQAHLLEDLLEDLLVAF
jgi:hypothetical protein